MKAKHGLLLPALAAGGVAGAWAFSPAYLKSITRGLLYGAGLKGIHLDGFARIIATIFGPAQHPPCFAQMHEHVQYLAKVPPSQFYLSDAGAMVRATKMVNDWYGMDIPLPFTDVYNFEAEALGAKMIYGDIDMPTIDFTAPLIQEPGDIERIDTRFQADWGRIRYVIEAVNGFKDVCGLPKILVFSAPFSLAAGLRSYPRLIRDMRKDPTSARRLFDWITEEVHPRYIELIKKETGVWLAMGADAWACFPNLTLDMIEEWVIPYNVKLAKRLLKMGIIPIIAGAGDYCEERVEMFDRATMEACWRTLCRGIAGRGIVKGMPIMAMGRTQEWPLEWLQEYAASDPMRLYGKRAIIASLNARFIREGPADAIVDYIKRVVDVLGREGRLFMLFMQIPAATPPEHVHAAVAALKTYGRYPIPEDIDEVKFEMPSFEPYETWLRKRS